MCHRACPWARIHFSIMHGVSCGRQLQGLRALSGPSSGFSSLLTIFDCSTRFQSSYLADASRCSAPAPSFVFDDTYLYCFGQFFECCALRIARILRRGFPAAGLPKNCDMLVRWDQGGRPSLSNISARSRSARRTVASMSLNIESADPAIWCRRTESESGAENIFAPNVGILF